MLVLTFFTNSEYAGIFYLDFEIKTVDKLFKIINKTVMRGPKKISPL